MEKQHSNAQNTSSDQQSAQMVHQALNDDQALSASADDIQVTVKDGAITLDGHVATEQQMNLAANTASAVGMVDSVDNHMVIQEEPAAARKSNKYRDAKRLFYEKKSVRESTKEIDRADDDGFAFPGTERIKKDSVPPARFLSLSNLHSVVSSVFEQSPFSLKKKDKLV